MATPQQVSVDLLRTENRYSFAIDAAKCCKGTDFIDELKARLNDEQKSASRSLMVKKLVPVSALSSNSLCGARR